MFSEYASRFLAQSQSRLSNFANDPSTGNGSGSGQPTSRYSRHPNPTPYASRLGNPYQPQSHYQQQPQPRSHHPGHSRLGSLNLASRYNTNDAPLFHSALNDFHDDDEDDARDAADMRALQRSRRVFVSNRFADSSASENDDSRASLDRPDPDHEDDNDPSGDLERSHLHHARGIRSSWTGESSFKDRPKPRDKEDKERDSDNSAKMVDVGLESAVLDDNDVPQDLLHEAPQDSSPPAVQKFRSATGPPKSTLPRKDSHLQHDQRLMRQTIDEEDEDDANNEPAIPEPAPPRMYGEIFTHDQFFAWIYLISLASLLATFVLVWLHTEAPSRKHPLGDTIYTTLHSSFHLLAVDTLVSVVVALVWMAALRSFVQPLVLFILLGVPIVLFSFSLYPIVSSFQGPDHGARLQDVVMRYAAIIPGVCAIIWTYLLYKGRHEVRSAIDILDFSSRILAANPGLVLLGFGSLAFVVGWTWVWLVMFTRIFLGGYFSRSLSAFIIGTGTWWLGIFFFLVYIWTLSVLAGVVRATTAGTVSNWYFFRNKQPPSPSNAVVRGALSHSTTVVFGTVCASTLLALAIRAPLLVLPRRLSAAVEFIGWRIAPRPISVLTNPLALTYAAIHSMPLMESAGQLSRVQFLATGPTTTLTPAAFDSAAATGHYQNTSLVPYRMAKMLLHAARFVMSTALGFAAWVMTARQLQVVVPGSGSGDGSNLGLRGSAYAYVVGLVAGMIGWGILGAMEGILSGILDGVLICYASERRLGAAGGYCMEAARLFEDRGARRGRSGMDIV